MASTGIQGQNSTTDNNIPYIIMILSRVCPRVTGSAYISIHESLFIHFARTQKPFPREKNTKKPVFKKSVY